MNKRPQLILDIAGVLVSNLSPLFWKQIAALSEKVSYELLKERFKADLRVDFWSGRIAEEEFWEWLIQFCPTLNIKEARILLNNNLIALPALDHLTQWSQYADIHLLSNHRMEWLKPLLKSIEPHIQSCTISSEVGFCKPDIRIYEILNSLLNSSKPILFVDDQEKNLLPATKLGWSTLHADSQGNWIEHVTSYLIKIG
jgi:FMN phosphatase YigB (HAD superfamily)